MLRTEIKLKKWIDIVLTIIILIGIVIILANSLYWGRYWMEIQNVKAVSYFLITILAGRLIYRITANRNVILKVSLSLLVGIMMTVGRFFFNNWVNFLNLLTFDYGFKYMEIVIQDLQYTYGLGIFRYVLFFIVYFFSYLYHLFGANQIVADMIESCLDVIYNLFYKFAKKIIEDYESDKENNDEED